MPTSSPSPMPVELVNISGAAADAMHLVWTLLAAFLGCLVAIGGAQLVRLMVAR